MGLFIPFSSPFFSAKLDRPKNKVKTFFGGLPNLKIKYRTAMDSKKHIISNLTFTLYAEHLFESRLVRLSFLLDKTSMEAGMSLRLDFVQILSQILKKTVIV